MNIDNIIIPQGKLGICPKWGAEVLTKYLSELQQVSAGVPYKALGISDRRKKSNVSIMEVGSSGAAHSKDRIAFLDIEGLIQAESGMSSVGTREQGDQLVDLKNSTIGAVIRINSGGGYMDGAEAMISAMREYGKPIVAIGGFMGSAAYMIATEADQIFADTNMSEFGSIGVYIELNKVFREKYKEFVEAVYAETSPDKNSEFRAWLDGDVSGFIQAANEADDLFMKLVKKNRDLAKFPDYKQTLAGGMWYQEEAKSRGLIDGLGNMEKAISIIQKLS